MDQLITVLAALLTLVIYAHDPRIRSWDGTTLRLEWDGSIYTAMCKSTIVKQTRNREFAAGFPDLGSTF